jgi:hypothetical protein
MAIGSHLNPPKHLEAINYMYQSRIQAEYFKDSISIIPLNGLRI